MHGAAPGKADGGGGGGGDVHTDIHAWTAAGAARAHVAALHCCAAWDAIEHGWKSMSAAAAKTWDSLGAIGSAVGRGNAVDLQVLVAGAAVMGEGTVELGTARAAFGAAGKRSRAEASERDMAAESYERAGASKAARAQRVRAKRARKRGTTADGWESGAAEKLAILTESLAVWKENIAMTSSAGVWRGDRTAWAAMHAGMRAGVENDRVRWAEMAKKSAARSARASDRLARAENEAKRACGAAGWQWAAGGKAGNGEGAGDEEAARALLDAMATAEQLSRG